MYLPMLIVFGMRGSLQRIIFPKSKMSASVWFHAASLGEVNALKPLITKFSDQHKKENIILTTMTRTGQAAGKNIAPQIKVCYVPLDLPHTMKMFYRNYKPQMLIIMETEFWPQMLYQAYRRKIPVIVINGRLSLRSYTNYSKTRYFWKLPFSSIKQINAQSEHDKKRFIDLGFNNVTNSGNLKFSLNLPLEDKEDLRRKFAIDKNEFVITFGSSRPGEEAMMLNILDTLIQEIGNLKLVIAPRHIKRLPEIEKLFKGIDYTVYSQLGNKASANILLIDEIGLLTQLYSISNLALVGGSFYDYGGHNPLEPAFYAKPIIMGIYHQSCRDSVKKLEEKQGILISKEENLGDNICRLHIDRTLRESMGENAKEVLEENADSLQKDLKTINQFYKDITSQQTV